MSLDSRYVDLENAGFPATLRFMLGTGRMQHPVGGDIGVRMTPSLAGIPDRIIVTYNLRSEGYILGGM